jgi:hypothetical protein
LTTESDLITVIRQVKNGLLMAINAQEVETFNISLNALQTLERKARSQGLDPTTPEFGPDLLREIADIKVDLLLGKFK